jgi:hypothetical protein
VVTRADGGNYFNPADQNGDACLRSGGNEGSLPVRVKADLSGLAVFSGENITPGFSRTDALHQSVIQP